MGQRLRSTIVGIGPAFFVLAGVFALLAAAPARAETPTTGPTVKLTAGAPIYTSARPGTPVYLAVLALQRDLEKVLGAKSSIRPLSDAKATGIYIAGPTADLPADQRRGAPVGWEAHRVWVEARSGPPQVVLQGADTRGTIYAIYTFSEQVLGVPPLWFYSSWQPTPQRSIDVPSSLDINVAAPVVKYRGWFPNDMDLLSDWRKRAPENDAMWLEAALRSKVNTIEWVDWENDYADAYSVTATTRLIRDHGLVNTTHHHSPLNASLKRWEDFWRDVKKAAAPELSIRNLDKLEEFWRYHVESVAKNKLEMLWVIGFRGRDDRPFWVDFKDAPVSMAERAEIINRVLARQMEIVLEVTGDPNAQFRTIFYDELSDLLSQGLLRPPADPNLVLTYVAARRDHYPNDDLRQLPTAGDRRLGYYFNCQFTSTGSHLAPAEGPWKMEANFRFAASRSRDPLACGVVNAGNIREHVFEVSAFAAMMWDFDGYDSESYLAKFCAQYFGQAQAAAAAGLYRDYYNAFWQPKRGDLPFVPRQYVFQDLRYRRAIEMLCSAFARPYDPEPLKDLGNEQVKGRTFRIVPADNGAEDQVSAIVRGTSASAERFLDVARRADRLDEVIPAAQRQFFRDNLRAPAHFMHHLNVCLRDLADAYRTRSDAARRRALLGSAKRELAAAEEAINGSAHGAFATWYRGDSVFGLRQLRAKLDRVEP